MVKHPPLQISDKVQGIPEALSIYINQLAYAQKRRGMDVIVLSLGEAFFDIPAFDFSKLDFVKGYHYSDSQGIPELREVISRFYKRQYGVNIDAQNEILITAGSKPVIYFAMQAALNNGDEVLIHEPAWLSYQEQARLVGAVATFIPYDIEVKDFHRYFNEKTKMLIINNPNNPAGRIYTETELQSIYEQCRTRGIYVLVDEAYSDFVIEDEFHSMAKIAENKEGIIVVNSLSKNMGMSGWRVGYVIAQPVFIRAILKLNQHIITCAPTILQYYMAEYFDEVIALTLPQVHDVVRKRERISSFMKDIGLKCMQGNATFYFLVNLENFPGTSFDFALYLFFKHQIAVVPGSAYGKSCARFIRVGIGAESDERIFQALLVIKDLILTDHFDPMWARNKVLTEGFHLFEEAQGL